jgi:hypothetical protein
MEVDDFSGKGKPVFAPAGEKPAKIVPFCIVIAAKQDVSVKSETKTKQYVAVTYTEVLRLFTLQSSIRGRRNK